MPEQSDVFGGITVGQAVHPQGSSHLRPNDCLGDLADALASNRRTAIAVTAEEGDVVGMATANDVMLAYFEGLPANTRLREWLSTSAARAPEGKLKYLEVRPDTLLSEVSAKMVANTVRGDCACHHVVVAEEDGLLRGVVSSHDLVEAFRYNDMWNHLPQNFEGTAPPADAEQEMASMLVRDIMKPRSTVFTCAPADTLRTALKALLMTRQNFLLVVGDKGIFGFVSARDMVKAFADATPLDTTIADFLSSQPPEKTHRTISSTAKVIEVAEDMTNHEVDHLVVVRPDDLEAVGVVSSLDFVLHTKAKDFALEARPWTGPTLSEVLKEHPSKTALCTLDTTLAIVCARLVAAGQTSVLVGEGSTADGLLTESDIVMAFTSGLTKDNTVGDLMLKFGEHEVPSHLQVPPSMHLLEAGSMMLHHSLPGRSCHHIVVRAVTGGWLGVFSALDVARILHHLAKSKLEVAKLNVDGLIVDNVMKPFEAVPTCTTAETLKDVLQEFGRSGQTAVAVMEGDAVLGLITPRCAMHALATGVPSSITVGEWMRTRQLPEGPREVLPTTPVVEAAAIMVELNLHHLLVVDTLHGAPAGVLSALDLVRGVVTMHRESPFLTLSWLRRVGLSANFAPQARAVTPKKHFAAESGDDLGIDVPEAKKPRTES